MFVIRAPVIVFGERGLEKANLAALIHFSGPTRQRLMVSIRAGAWCTGMTETDMQTKIDMLQYEAGIIPPHTLPYVYIQPLLFRTFLTLTHPLSIISILTHCHPPCLFPSDRLDPSGTELFGRGGKDGLLDLLQAQGGGTLLINSIHQVGVDLSISNQPYTTDLSM